MREHSPINAELPLHDALVDRLRIDIERLAAIAIAKEGWHVLFAIDTRSSLFNERAPEEARSMVADELRAIEHVLVLERAIAHRFCELLGPPARVGDFARRLVDAVPAGRILLCTIAGATKFSRLAGPGSPFDGPKAKPRIKRLSAR